MPGYDWSMCVCAHTPDACDGVRLSAVPRASLVVDGADVRRDDDDAGWESRAGRVVRV